MGIFSRFTNLLRMRANTALDKAEDPGEVMDYSYSKQLEQLQQLRRSIADVVTNEKRLEMLESQFSSRATSSTSRQCKHYRQIVKTWRELPCRGSRRLRHRSIATTNNLPSYGTRNSGWSKWSARSLLVSKPSVRKKRWSKPSTAQRRRR